MGFLAGDVFEGQPGSANCRASAALLWGAYNAITCFEDYKQPQQEELQDQRLERTWFGGGADNKLKALENGARDEVSASWN